MIFKYSEFLNEVTYSKLKKLRNTEISNLFTSSIEIELETEDLEEREQDYSEKYVDQIVEKIKNSTIKQLLRIDKFVLSESISTFIDDILEEVKYEYEDFDYLIDEILNEDTYTDEKKLVVQLIKPQVLSYFYSEDFEFLEDKFKANFKHFYKKYQKLIKFEIDNTLTRGIELSNLTYFNNIEDLILFIEDFYKDYNNQSYWKFTDATGVHINLGIKSQPTYNVIKGLLFLDDDDENPFVFKNMEWRKKSKFCKSLISELKKEKNIIEKCLYLLKDNKIIELENLINDRLINILIENGYKNYGVNLIPLKNFNYIEFRYPGGEIEERELIDKVLYFSYIVYLMTNLEVDRNLYLKKIYSFLEKNK